MATTGFWPIKGRLKDAIDYAENPDKTTDRKYLDEDLYSALRYAANDEKTDKKRLLLPRRCIFPISPRQSKGGCWMRWSAMIVLRLLDRLTISRNTA